MAHIQFDLALPEYLTLEREAGYLGITRLRVRLAQRGYGLVCRGRNPRRLHEAISLGRIASLKSVGDRTVFQVQALYIDGELRFAASSVRDAAALKTALLELVDQLADAVVGEWRRTGQETGLSLGPVVAGSPSLCGPGITVERDGLTRVRVALPDLGDVHLAHVDHVVGGRPIADPVVALVLGSKGRDDAPLLADEALREDLLAVLHGLPGSLLSGRELVVITPDSAGDALVETIRRCQKVASRVTEISR